MQLQIRPEKPADIPGIYALTKAAFAPMPFAAGNEQDLVDALRAAGALSLSLVAETDGELVGHAALSPATHASGAAGWYALGPISVSPGRQRSGIGAAMISEAQGWLRGQGAAGCILTGNPAYYSRFGFKPAPAHAPEAEPAQYFMVWTEAGAAPPAGRFAFHPAFYQD